jgi:hypothetical protein
MEARFPGTKEGVFETMRRDDRKGAVLERICTEAGRRSCCPGGGEVWKESRFFEGDDVRDAAEGGLAGAVTERLITMPRGRGAGPDGVRVDMRLGTTMDPSAFWSEERFRCKGSSALGVIRGRGYGGQTGDDRLRASTRRRRGSLTRGR